MRREIPRAFGACIHCVSHSHSEFTVTRHFRRLLSYREGRAVRIDRRGVEHLSGLGHLSISPGGGTYPSLRAGVLIHLPFLFSICLAASLRAFSLGPASTLTCPLGLLGSDCSPPSEPRVRALGSSPCPRKPSWAFGTLAAPLTFCSSFSRFLGTFSLPAALARDAPSPPSDGPQSHAESDTREVPSLESVCLPVSGLVGPGFAGAVGRSGRGALKGSAPGWGAGRCEIPGGLNFQTPFVESRFEPRLPRARLSSDTTVNNRR